MCSKAVSKNVSEYQIQKYTALSRYFWSSSEINVLLLISVSSCSLCGYIYVCMCVYLEHVNIVVSCVSNFKFINYSRVLKWTCAELKSVAKLPRFADVNFLSSSKSFDQLYQTRVRISNHIHGDPTLEAAHVLYRVNRRSAACHFSRLFLVL